MIAHGAAAAAELGSGLIGTENAASPDTSDDNGLLAVLHYFCIIWPGSAGGAGAIGEVLIFGGRRAVCVSRGTQTAMGPVGSACRPRRDLWMQSASAGSIVVCVPRGTQTTVGAVHSSQCGLHECCAFRGLRY